MPNNDKDNSTPEYKKITEELYKRNLELARLYKKVDKLNKDLGIANSNLKDLIKQRESLVHLITHKVKGSFTRSKYIFAGILDGSFGDVSAEIEKRAKDGLDSDNAGIQTVDFVLNAANLQKGTIKYEMKLMDFRTLVEKLVEDKIVQAQERGLAMRMEAQDEGYQVWGDVFWLKEAINNLIDNAIKYTRQGEIIIKFEVVGESVQLSVKDTGIGITLEDQKNLFTEGGRGPVMSPSNHQLLITLLDRKLSSF